MRHIAGLVVVAAVVALMGCAAPRQPGQDAGSRTRADGPPERPEAWSLLGRPLARPELPPERRLQLVADLTAAAAAHELNPKDEDATIWFGRRLAYLGRYDDAIA